MEPKFFVRSESGYYDNSSDVWSLTIVLGDDGLYYVNVFFFFFDLDYRLAVRTVYEAHAYVDYLMNKWTNGQTEREKTI